MVLASADALRTWGIPIATVGAVLILAALSARHAVATPTALAGTIAAVLVLLLYLGERPLISASRPARVRALGAGFGLVWLVVCYAPFHARLFPGRPLLEAAQVTATGDGLPLRIPAAGARAVDLVLEGRLTPSPGGGAAPPVRYRLTVEGGSGARTVEGVFEDRIATRRLGRRGTTVVHQTRTADVRMLPNPTRGDMRVTHLVLEPESAQPITVTAFAHPLPAPFVLGLSVLGLLGAAIAFDRLGPVPETDGALTLSTAAVLGTAAIFWTSNAAHPDYRALIGAAILGGVLGFAAGALLWWVAKRLIVRPEP